MKKYVLFAYHDYYPSGGMNDLYDSYDTLEEAITATQREFTPGCYGFDIVDRDTWELIK